MTDYQDIDKAEAGAPTPTYAKAPPVTVTVYEETMPTLYTSSLIYDFTEIITLARDSELALAVPEGFLVKDPKRFLSESMDLTEYNNGNGVSFAELNEFIEFNKEVLCEKFPKSFSVERMREMYKETGDKMFLTHLRSIQGDVACVYGVIKDTVNQKILVTFRGSVGGIFNGRDWRSNLNARVVGMETPKKIAGLMKGKLQERVLVHRGFYNYLFDNSRMKGDQRYDNILKDIKAALGDEKGYSVYVTGHSLGGALANMFSCKLAGGGSSTDFIPRPITCITFAAPFSGTAGYRTAYEYLEQKGFLRALRINNGEDLVPAIPPFSLLRKRLMKQVGINLRLTSGDPRVEHTTLSGFFTAIRNSIMKPVWFMKHWHGLALHQERLEKIKDQLTQLKLDDLYKKPEVVSKAFMGGEPL